MRQRGRMRRALFDPGLQLERTHLAWNRTAFGFLVNSALMARLAHRLYPAAAGTALAAAFAIVGAATWAHGRRTYAPRAQKLFEGQPPAQPGPLRALALGTAVLAISAATLALTTLLVQ